VERRLEELVRRAADAGVQRVVCVSSAGAAEGTSEFRLERAVEAAGLPMVALRPTMLLQTLSHEHRVDIAVRETLRLPLGSTGMALIDAADVADVVVKAVTDPPAAMARGGTFTLTGGAAVSPQEIAECLSAHLGRCIRSVPLTFREYRRSLVASGRSVEGVHAALLQNAAMRVVVGGRVVDTVERLLGRLPMSLDRYVGTHLSDWQS
jgi:uncharacterized protein YbjT (DUF2867 family)